MLKTLKKMLLLLVILLLTPTPALAHGFLAIIESISYVFLFGLVAGAISSAVRLSRIKGLFISVVLAILGSILYYLVTDFKWGVDSIYLLFRRIVFFELSFGIVPFVFGFFPAWSLVNSLRKRTKI